MKQCYLNRTQHQDSNRNCKQVMLPKEEMVALQKDRVLIEEVKVSVISSYKIHNEEVKPRPMICKNKKRQFSMPNKI